MEYRCKLNHPTRCLSYAPINVKPEGGGGPRAYVGHLITFAISALGNLTESLGPWVGTFDCFGEVDWALVVCCMKAATSKREEWRAVVFISWMY